jgi:hypothetical protein
MSDNEILPDLCHKYNCKFCDYHTNKKSSYDTHIESRKHKNNELSIKNNDFSTNNNAKFGHKIYICKNCEKQFNDRAGLWRHNKKCNADDTLHYIDADIETDTDIDEDNITIDNFQELTDKQMMMFILKQNMNLIKENSEFKNMMFEQQNIMMEVIKNGTHNTNSHNTTTNKNKTFNLNFFLNEQCKDAMNIMDFVNTLKIEMEDLETTGRKGFVEGISNLIMKNMKALDTFKRPIHCSDLKRETFYIRDNNIWEKDNEEKDKMKKVIKDVAFKNIKQILPWTEKHPDCKDPQSKKNDLYLNILSNAMSGSNEEETEKNVNNIVRNIAKHVTIDKE